LEAPGCRRETGKAKVVSWRSNRSAATVGKKKKGGEDVMMEELRLKKMSGENRQKTLLDEGKERPKVKDKKV